MFHVFNTIVIQYIDEKLDHKWLKTIAVHK
jgi:hypothetical protein